MTSAGQKQHPFRTFGVSGLKAVPVSSLVHDVDRVVIMEDYTKVLCSAIGCGEEQSPEQADFISCYLMTKKFLPKIVDTVPQQIEDAASLPEEAIVWEVSQTIRAGKLKHTTATVVHDMFRASAVNGFPPAQVATITAIANEVGIENDVVQKIKAAAATEAGEYIECHHGHQQQILSRAA